MIRALSAVAVVAVIVSPAVLAWGEAERAACERLAAYAEGDFKDMLRYEEQHYSMYNYRGVGLWQIEVPRLLREVGRTGQVNMMSPGGFSALLAACYYNDAELVRMLLEAGADVNVRAEGWRGYGFVGDTPLGVTVRGLRPELAETRVAIAKMLLEHGANPDAPMMDWYWGASAPVMPFDYVPDGAHGDAMRLALMAGGQMPLVQRARLWKLDWGRYSSAVISVLLENGVNPNSGTDAEGRTLLFHLACRGEVELMKQAIAKGAVARDSGVLRMIHGGHLFALPAQGNCSPEQIKEIAKLLIQAGADVNATRNGVTLQEHYSAHGLDLPF